MAWNYVATHRRRRFSSGISDLEDQEAEGQATKDKKGEKEGKRVARRRGQNNAPRSQSGWKIHLLQHKRTSLIFSMAIPIGGALSTTAGEVIRNTSVKVVDWRRKSKLIQKPWPQFHCALPLIWTMHSPPSWKTNNDGSAQELFVVWIPSNHPQGHQIGFVWSLFVAALLPF